MRNIPVSITIMLLASGASSQSITHATIGTLGGQFRNGNVYLNYTLGESFIGLQTNGTVQLGNGFWTVIPTAHGSVATLPVSFLRFTADITGDHALLSWQVTNESSITSYYDLERSIDGVDFNKLRTTLPKNNGSTTNSYDLIDLDIFSISSKGLLYYRVKQVDKDGRFVYSITRMIRINDKKTSISVYPNPLTSFANVIIDLEQDVDATITIHNAAGRLVQHLKTRLFKGKNNKEINMAHLSPGNYILTLQANSEIKIVKLVKASHRH